MKYQMGCVSWSGIRERLCYIMRPREGRGLIDRAFFAPIPIRMLALALEPENRKERHITRSLQVARHPVK